MVERDRPAGRSSGPPTSSAAGAPASPPRREEFAPHRRRRPRRQPHHRDPHRAVDRRLEGVRARGHARPGRQLRGRLLDREPRPDGRAHRRLDHGGPGPDAVRRRVPAHARRRLRLHPPGRRGDRRLQRAVRPRPRQRRHGRHRDEPPGQPVLGAGLEGHRVPDRQDRRPPGRRLHARRDPQRHHPQDAGQLRADHRLRGHQGAALGVREVPGHAPACSAPRCSRWARPWPSAARSPSRCRRRCARSSTAGSGSTATRPRRRSTPSTTTSWSARAAVGHPRPALPARGRAAPGHRRRPTWPRPPGSTPGSSTRCCAIVEERAHLAAAGLGRHDRRRLAAGQAARLLRRPAGLPVGRRRGRRPRRPRWPPACGPRSRRSTPARAEFEAATPYHYSTYEDEDEVRPQRAAPRC